MTGRRIRVARAGLPGILAVCAMIAVVGTAVPAAGRAGEMDHAAEGAPDGVIPLDPFREGRLVSPLDSLAAAMGFARDDLRVDPAALAYAGFLDGADPLARYWLQEPLRAPAMIADLARDLGRWQWKAGWDRSFLARLGAWREGDRVTGPATPPVGATYGAIGLADAVESIFAGTGKRFRGREREVMEREAATLPPVIARELAGLIEAVGEASRSRDRCVDTSAFRRGGLFRGDTRRTREELVSALFAYRDGDLTEREISDDVAGSFPLEALLAAAIAVERAGEDAERTLLRERAALSDREFQYRWATPAGWIALGGTGRNRYEGEHLLIVDFGGDDVYRGAGGVTAGDPGVSVLLDLDGDDLYAAADSASAAAGGAILGIAGLFDASGNDVYEGAAFGAGFGCFGVGWIQDASGDDVYRFGALAVGAALRGYGVLADLAGNDRYLLTAPAAAIHGGSGMGQGFAGSGGVGALMDFAGDDVYEAAESPEEPDGDPGVRWVQGAGGGWTGFPDPASPRRGVGLLFDFSGRDRYVCGGYGQGAASGGAVGCLTDFQGDDVYMAPTHGGYANGWGDGGGFGIFLEGAGDDSMSGLFPGIGTDFGAGLCLDLDGADVVRARSLGNASDGGAGWFLDAGGEDTYEFLAPGRDRCMGGGGNTEARPRSVGAPTTSIFIDAAGPNRISGSSLDGWHLSAGGARYSVAQGAHLRGGAWWSDLPAPGNSKPGREGQ